MDASSSRARLPLQQRPSTGKGHRRLTIKSDGDEHHYCLACAKTFLAADIKPLQTLLEQAYAGAL
jgi:hypothetical protein